ncbi:MAG: DUF3014 domain-containing protein [Pseudomonadales bacterium]|nr:DUF3014 domain-containing protein [Pseudomonadales bacterium]
MSKTGLLTIISVAVLSLLALVYLAATWDSPEGTTTVVIAPPVEPTPQEESETPTSRPVNSVLPQIRIQPQQEPPPQAAEPTIAEAPVEVVVEEPEPAIVEETAGPSIQLPSLNASDGFVFTELRGLTNGAAVVSLLAEDQIVRKFVVFVENISRGDFPQTGLPYKPLGQEMPVRNIDENLFVMEDVAHSRFDSVVDTFVALDTDAAMALYRLLSPLFQQAYAEIGFRDTSFDETLERAINNVLETTDIEGPFQLVKPSVMYLYADASIENLQEVHKQLIRMGPENTEKLKSKLREFQERL